jgi:hypothetical protein
MSQEEEKRKVKKRGLAYAPAETRSRVSYLGGISQHQKRGLQAADHETRVKVARKGGLARGAQRKKKKEDQLSPGTRLSST